MVGKKTNDRNYADDGTTREQENDSVVRKKAKCAKKVLENTTSLTKHPKFDEADLESDSNCPDPILEVKSVSGTVFKHLFDTLKAVLTDANFIFTSEGLKMAAIDSHRNSYVHLSIDASSFEYYKCGEERVRVGVDVDNLQKILKTIKQQDSLTFVVSREDPQYLNVIIANQQKGNRATNLLKLKNLEVYAIEDCLRYPLPPQMDAVLFQSICREMNSFQATKLLIRIEDNKLIFKNLDGIVLRTLEVKFSKSETADSIDVDEKHSIHNHEHFEHDENDEDDELNADDYTNASGIFYLRFLKSFAKASNLSSHVRLYLTNDNPLICEYDVSGLGTLKYVLSPVPEDV